MIDISNIPIEFNLPNNEKVFQIACGNTFSCGLFIPLSNEEFVPPDVSTISVVYDSLDMTIQSDAFFPSPFLQSQIQPSQHFTFNTNEIINYQSDQNII